MTKTNSLKKALAGILAACLAATTLVAAPFTFGGSQDVGAASLDEMELLAQYSFESGYTDSVSGEAGTLSESTPDSVTLEKEGANTYLSVQGAPETYNNILEVANPFKGDAATDMTIAMNVRVDASTTDAFQGLWAFYQTRDGYWVGLCNSGGFHYSYSSGFHDYRDYEGSIPVDSQWHEVVTTITAEGILTLYVDGQAKYTINDAMMVSGFYQYDYFAIGSGVSNMWSWGSATADYDDVRLYSGAADAQAVAEIYEDDTPEAVASYDFEDDAQIAGMTLKSASIVEDDVQGNVLEVVSNSADDNYLAIPNPFYQQPITDFTVSMNVQFNEATSNGLWGFMNDNNSGALGMCDDTGLYFNAFYSEDSNVWFDGQGNALNAMSAGSDWSKLAVVFKVDGTTLIYVNGALKGEMNFTDILQGANADAISAVTSDELNEFITTRQYLYLGVSAFYKNTTGARYDNVAFYNTALTDLQIANLPGTAQVPTESEEPDEPTDPTQPYLLTKEQGKWQVIDGQSINTSSKGVSGYITGNNFSVSGWMNFNSISGNNMYLFQMQGANDAAHGVRFSTSSDGKLRTWLMNSTIDTSWDSDEKLPVDETFLFTLNYDGDNHAINVYINNELYFTYTNETSVIAGSAYPISNVLLGTSQWGDPTLDGRIADLYISNELISEEEIAAKVAAADYPAWDETSDAVIPQVAERENLNIIESSGTVTYDDNAETDSNGNKVITEVTGNAKAQLSDEKYTQQTLSTNDVTQNAGYREFDTEAFLENADDFSLTAWVRWYGDQATSWSSAQSLNAQRFFDLFSIDDDERGEYEFFFNGWEENYYARNMSQTRATADIQEAIDELTQYNNFANWSDSANAEAAVYLCGITAGATMNGLSRPCFRPGATYAANNNQTNSGLPYQWTHIGVVYDADGHKSEDGSVVYGASLTYYVDGTAYAYRYYDYADFDEMEDEFYQNNSSPRNAYFIDGEDGHARPDSNSQIVGGSADGADIIYGLASAEALKIKNMGLDTLYLGKSTASEALWNGEYQNAYLYNYAISSGDVGEDYIDNVKPFEGATMDEATEGTNIAPNGSIYALITEEDEASKTMETGFNTEWFSTSYRGSSSLSFNGEGGYAEVDTSLLQGADGTVSDKLTFSTWLNLNDDIDWGRVFDIRGNNGEIFLSNHGWFNNDSDIGLGFRSSTLNAAGLETSHTDTSEGQAITAGNWVNVTVVIDGLNVSLYYQGELQATGEMEMTLSEMDVHTFYLSRSCAVDGKYGLPLDADNDILLDETYLVLDALSADQVKQLGQYGYAGAASSLVSEDNSRLEMLDVENLFDESRNVDVMYFDISDHTTLSAEVMNALANSTGKTLYVRVQQGVSYDFVWVLSSEAFAGRSYTSADEFDLLVSGTNMTSADATTILTKWSQIDPSANVNLQAQTITVYADKLPVELPLFINYNREFLNSDGTTLTDVSLNLYRGTASSYSLVTKGLAPATDLSGRELKQNYTHPTTGASGVVNEYYVQNLTQGGSFILTPQELP